MDTKTTLFYISSTQFFLPFAQKLERANLCNNLFNWSGLKLHPRMWVQFHLRHTWIWLCGGRGYNGVHIIIILCCEFGCGSSPDDKNVIMQWTFRYNRRFFTCGCSHLSTNWDMGSVMLLQLDTIACVLFPFGFYGFFSKNIILMCMYVWLAKIKTYLLYLLPFLFNALSLSMV